MSYSTAILIVILFSLAAGFCVFVIRKCVHIGFLQKHHEVAFTIFLQEGVIYGVLLAFSVSIVWGQFNQVSEEIEKEVSSLLVVSKLSGYYPQPLHNNIQQDLQKYMHSVVDREWRTMRNGNSDPQAQNNFDQLQSDLLQYKPQNLADSIIYSESLRHLSDARDARRMRLFHSGVRVPGVIWIILVALGFLVITLPLFFGMENRFSQAIITAGLTGMITAILVLIVLLDDPFGKSLHVEKDAFIQGLEQINLKNY